MQHEESKILKLLQSENRCGMELLFENYYRPLVLFADQYLHDIDRAEDVVQEQFIKFWENSLFEGIHEKALTSYLYTITRSACLNILERRGIQTESISAYCYEVACHEATGLDDGAVQLIRSALNKLPERTRQIVYSVVCESFSYAETAVRFGISINTVKTSLKKGMKELRENLGQRKDLLVFLFCFRKLFK